MSEILVERTREREPEPTDTYDRFIESQQARLRRTFNGKLVLKKSDYPLEQSRQGLIRWFLNSQEDEHDYTAQSAVDGWDVFTHDIKNQSGKHRHQGGLIIYVVSGRGHTIVEGERVDWKAGDLLLLPVLPGGVEHQHFNDESGDAPVQWVAFIFRPMHDAVGSFVEQISEAPDFAH